MDLLSYLRAQICLLHDPESSGGAWPPHFERCTGSPRPILSDAHCCFHNSNRMVSFFEVFWFNNLLQFFFKTKLIMPQLTLALNVVGCFFIHICVYEKMKLRNPKHERVRNTNQANHELSLDIVVVNQLPGELQPFPLSKFDCHQHLEQQQQSEEHQSSPAASDTKTILKTDEPIPACYLRIEEDVFFLDHSVHLKINFPTRLPKDVPPYIDMSFGKDKVMVR
jgi:hypothetical protein